MFDLQRFVSACRETARSGSATVLELMRNAIADPAALKDAVSGFAPTRTIADAVIHRSADLLVLHAVLEPYTASPPHDHTMWAVIGIYEGREDNTFFERQHGALREKNRRSIHAGEALVLGPEVVHAVANPLSTPTLGIHVYGGDLLAARRTIWDPQTVEELPYEIPQFFQWVKELTKARRESAGRQSDL